MSSLRDQVALVTGSSRGIGAAIAKSFAQQGAKVVVHGRDGAAISSIRKEIELAGGRSMQVSGDVTNFTDVEAARLRIEREFGPVDILVANAGGSLTPPGPLEDTSEEGWRASVEGNLTATFLTIKSFLPGVKERRRGSIITISSAAGRRPNRRSPIPYSVAKAGIELMSQDVALQAGPYGIRVNCIAPETILTERNLERIPKEQIASLMDSHPLKRLGTPEDVPCAAVFLASGEAGWITGVVLDVAGGAVMLIDDQRPKKQSEVAGTGAGGSYRCDRSMHGQRGVGPRDCLWEHSYVEGEFLIKPIPSAITAIARMTAPDFSVALRASAGVRKSLRARL